MKTFETDFAKLMRRRDNRKHFRIVFWCVFALCFLMLVLQGCSKVAPKDPYTASDYRVYDVYLNDGTHCAIYSSYYGGGITCNWKADRE